MFCAFSAYCVHLSLNFLVSFAYVYVVFGLVMTGKAQLLLITLMIRHKTRALAVAHLSGMLPRFILILATMFDK